MVKNILALSMVASLALFTVGCGGGGSDDTTQEQVDTTAPVFTNTTSQFTVTEETNTSVTLTATDENNVTFSIPAVDHFTLVGSKLTFSAPRYEDNASNEYNVTVTATDTAANSSQKAFSFLVEPKRASNVIVPIGDKNLTKTGNTIIGPAGLTWLNDDAQIMTYAEAVQYCEDADNGSGYRVARRDEILNLMNYETPNNRALEDEFVNTASVSWAAKVDGTFFEVNLNSGADGIVADGTPTYSVLCVKGRSANPHTFKASETNSSVIIDESTNMAWTKVVTDNDEYRRAITPDDTVVPGVNPQAAVDFCPTGYRLPNIVELRSLVDYATNSVNEDIIPPVANKTIIVWSSTQDKTDTTGVDKNFHINATEKGIISTDPKTEPFFVTCVKAAQ